MSVLSDVEIIDQYTKGQRSDITICKNHFFMPVRISGVGKTLRLDEAKSQKEILKAFESMNIKIKGDSSFSNLVSLYKENSDQDIQDLLRFNVVDRDSENFTNKQVLEALQGLPIIKEHPDNGELLTYTNLRDNPIIGTIVKTYLTADNEIWGIAKIYDLTLLDDLDRLKSTSPAVVSTMSYEENDKNNEKDDIIKEYPLHFNHLAFVEKGHWDQVSDKAYEANDITLNIDKENAIMADTEAKVDETTQKAEVDEASTEQKVEKLENNEKQEAKEFKKLAEQHSNLADSDKNPILDKEDDMVTKNTIPNEEVQDKDTTDEVKDSEETDEVKDSEETDEVKDSGETDEVTDSKEEVEDEEEIKDEAENMMDEERWSLISHFREAKDASHPNLQVKMPHIDKRLNPSAVISKILSLNSHLVNPKYGRAIDSKYDVNNYALQVDAFNDLLSTIESQTAKEFKEVGKIQSGFTPTSKSHIQIDRNF